MSSKMFFERFALLLSVSLPLGVSLSLFLCLSRSSQAVHYNFSSLRSWRCATSMCLSPFTAQTNARRRVCARIFSRGKQRKREYANTCERRWQKQLKRGTRKTKIMIGKSTKQFSWHSKVIRIRCYKYAHHSVSFRKRDRKSDGDSRFS